MNKVNQLFGLALAALGVVVFALGAQARPPSVKLGVVAQRYPWNGLVDVSYKADALPKDGVYAAVVVEVGETVVTNSIDVIVDGEGQAVLDLQAIAPETMGVAKFSIVADKTPSWPIDVQTKIAGEGSVSGGKQCYWGTQTTLTATPAPGFSFLRWSDGDTTNPRTVTVDGTVYTAEFGLLTAMKLGAKADGYPYFDQTFTFRTNGFDNASSKYWGWAADFSVSFSKAIPAKTLKLATKFNGDAEWDQSIKGDDLEAGVEYSIKEAGTYGDLCSKKALDFAVWAYGNQNLDTKMTIWFKMTNETEQITQKLAEYTFEELVKVVIRPSGATEETAPYAIEMPEGSGYYVITNHTWDIMANETDHFLTMTGLKGDETVRLNWGCQIVSNAHENTTFLPMSAPKKTTKGAYRYLPVVIPDSKIVCQGYNPVDHTFATALGTNAIPRVETCLNETNKFTSWWTTYPMLSYVVMRCTNLVERTWDTVSSIEYRTEAYETHFFETKGSDSRYRPTSFYRVQAADPYPSTVISEFIESGEGQKLVYEASTNAVDLIYKGVPLYSQDQIRHYVDLVTNDEAYATMNPCVKWAIDPSGSSVTFHVKSDKIPDPVEEFTLEKPFTLSQQPSRGLVGYQAMPIRVITTDPVPPKGGEWDLYDVRPVKGTITKSANEVTLTVPLDAVITCDMTVREWLKDAKTL